MIIRAGVIEKLQLKQDDGRTTAESVEGKAHPDKTKKGTDEDQKCQGLQIRWKGNENSVTAIVGKAEAVATKWAELPGGP